MHVHNIIHPLTHTCTHAHTHTHIHTHTHTHTHKHTHTHNVIHKHTQTHTNTIQCHDMTLYNTDTCYNDYIIILLTQDVEYYNITKYIFSMAHTK